MQKNVNNKMHVIGIMSGTSLDGLDIALCQFDINNDSYNYSIKKAVTINYSQEWAKLLKDIKNASAEDYFKLNSLYGKFIGEKINEFLKGTDLIPDAIASHGHTIFHQPKLGFSTQIGCGATIAATTRITTVCDFRSLDVANGGQGAPLVPIGDKLLFSEYEACLNIGGIANISFNDKGGNRIAYDICEANMLLNYLSEKIGQAYDRGGELAKTGKINNELLNKLNSQKYYSQKGAKSIGREWFEQIILPLIENSGIEIKDLLATTTEHVAQIIANDLVNKKNVLVTGGGAFNSFLIESIKSKTSCEIIIPDAETINFKEALIFAFLGYLRLNKKINTLSSVTGAKSDSIGGAVYLSDL
ncbi:MAG: anhydro-N-acetylmuramic acid kinase [Bacteroidota bacterium]|nr:anhydro-N-acetylmuramic acid kinase [Bacteroidota bacterium]